MVRFRKIQVKGFRAFSEQHVFDFDHSVVLIFGENGTGKSSLLNAIEFGLYGEIENLHGEEFTLTKDEIINDFAPEREASVELSIVGSEGTEYTINRTKKPGERGSILIVRVNDVELEGKSAQRRIDQLVSSLDFHSSAYLRQGLLNDIILGGPKNRARAIDSLIGIEDLNEILESIPLGYALERKQTLERRVESIEAERIGASRAFEKDLENMNVKLGERGVAQPVEFEDAKALYDRVKESLKSFAESSEYLGRTERSLQTIEEMRNSSRILTDFYRRLLREPGMEVRDLRERIGTLRNFLKALDKLTEGLKMLPHDMLDTLAEKSSIETEISQKTKEKSVLEHEIDFSRNVGTFLESALLIMEESDKNKCPLCNSEFDRTQLIKHIRQELETEKPSEILKNTRKKMADLDKRIGTLKARLGEFERIEEKFAFIKKELKTESKESHLFDIVPLDKDVFELDSFPFLNQMQMWRKRIEDKVIDLENQEEKARSEREQQILGIEQSIDTLNLMVDFIEKKSALSDLRKVFPDVFEQKKKLETRLAETQRFTGDLRMLCSHLEKSRTKASKEILEALEPQINLIYTRLRPHPVYGTLSLEAMRGKGRAGKRLFSYMIKAASKDESKKTYVKTKFSQAQINVAGISIFLALVLGAPHQLETLILDEPDQSLDLNHKANLAAILRDLQSHKQIIVATQDDDFQKALLEQLVPPSGESRAVYRLDYWQPEHGPKISHSIDNAPEM
jgi:DNA repair exonuclease SbcCD ATPase subunit